MRLADRAVCIGPPPAAESYLSIPAVIAAAETTGCEAVHPGYGFLAENPAFVDARARTTTSSSSGPPPEVMARMGDKVAGEGRDAARPACRSCRAPSGATTLEEARAAADEIGYPVLLKAAAGGGGKGMRLVDVARTSSRTRTARAAGEAQARVRRRQRSTSRRCVAPARHVEIQVLCDAHGGVLTLGERECSIQRRHQKLIEESPSPALDAGARARRWRRPPSARAGRSATVNAGTFEFLLGPDGSFYFIELNARLQVEHPVTELVTGIDIVREQLRIAAGRAARAHRPRAAATGTRSRSGSTRRIRRAASCRRPAASTRFRPPLGPGVRVDTHRRGRHRGPAVLRLAASRSSIVWDADRPAAIARALRALGELEIEGVPTTREAALEILAQRGVPERRLLDDVPRGGGLRACPR